MAWRAADAPLNRFLPGAAGDDTIYAGEGRASTAAGASVPHGVGQPQLCAATIAHRAGGSNAALKASLFDLAIHGPIAAIDGRPTLQQFFSGHRP